jgi:lon-related putative ATP-dependent protease
LGGETADAAPVLARAGVVAATVPQEVIAMISALPVEDLRRTCSLEAFSCQTTDEMEPLEAIIGQERAAKSLEFGLAIGETGFNIYVAGMTGTGRTTAVRRFLEDVARDKPVPKDLCYVNNFHDPYRPKALCLPPGRGAELQNDLKGLVENVRTKIRAAFESDEYASRREETARTFQRQRNEFFVRMNEQAQQEGFLIQSTPVGLVTVPMKEGKPLAEEEFRTLTGDEQRALSEQRDRLQEELKGVMRQVRALDKSAQEALQTLDRDVGTFAVSDLIEDVAEAYKDLTAVTQHLDEMRDDIIEHLGTFREQPQQQRPPGMPFPDADEALRRYDVNVLVDNGDRSGAPVITELNPTYPNLFGKIEKEARFGALTTDFTMIREGSLHRANGGYLVLPVNELLRNPMSWESLKRALRNGEINIEEAGERLGFLSAKSLRPEPCPLTIKVILIGRPDWYQMLYSMDEDFRELFKVKADFDTRMDCTEENILSYAAFVCNLCCDEGLKHLDRSALGKLSEHGSRLAGDQGKLTTRFSDLADVVREASFYAEQEDEAHISAKHVKQAIDERFYRSNLIQERINEMIERDTVMIDVAGAKVGQVNGLSVLGLGDIAFGRPSRITVSLGLGREGIIDIERQARLAGPIHSKGVMILSGYLAHQYAQDKPLSLSARLVFEQSYSGVEGDSASSTELYAILSALSGLPIRQAIAVTGSVNQRGEVQAIGGVNEKIEGFFEVCRAKRLTGEQGVMIPAANVPNLMLKDEVIDAVKDGTFRIWAVRTIDEGIEVLTGVTAGERQPDGSYDEGSVHSLADARLAQMAETLRQYVLPQDGLRSGDAEV